MNPSDACPSARPSNIPTRVLVTGGGTGLGRGIAASLVARGLEVVICGRRNAPLEATAQALDVEWVQGDVTGDPAALLDAAGAVDGLVHNAGVCRYAPLGEWTAADWDLHHAVHVRGPALLSQCFAARVEAGAIVFVSSTLSVRSAPHTAAYAASKAGVDSLTRSLAQALAPRIRVNSVQPGVVPTAMTRADRDGTAADAQLEALRALHPMDRLGTPNDVGAAVAFLLCAPWITGAQVPVDGGLLIG